MSERQHKHMVLRRKLTWLESIQMSLSIIRKCRVCGADL